MLAVGMQIRHVTYLTTLTPILFSFCFREKIENILQKTLFEPKKLLEETVSDTMTKTLEIRDAVLKRTKSLRL